MTYLPLVILLVSWAAWGAMIWRVYPPRPYEQVKLRTGMPWSLRWLSFRMLVSDALWCSGALPANALSYVADCQRRGPRR